MRCHGLVAAGLVSATLSVIGCQSSDEDGPRYRSPHGQFSMPELDGWTMAHERDAAVFTGPAELGLERNTVAVRSVPIEGDWVERRTPDLVLPATSTVLAALPKASVKLDRTINTSRFVGGAFSVSFEPRSRKGERYERRHVVLVGKQRVLHVVHTAPAGQLAATAELFDWIVDQIREEV